MPALSTQNKRHNLQSSTLTSMYPVLGRCHDHYTHSTTHTHTAGPSCWTLTVILRHFAVSGWINWACLSFFFQRWMSCLFVIVHTGLMTQLSGLLNRFSNYHILHFHIVDTHTHTGCVVVNVNNHWNSLCGSRARLCVYIDTQICFYFFYSLSST